MATEPILPTPDDEPEQIELTALDALKQGAAAWKQWRSDHPEEPRPDLSKADLSGLNLSGFDLSRVNLRHAQLTKLRLRGADLREADLYDARLSDVDFSGADLRGSDLREAQITDDSSVTDASFQDADLRKADLLALSELHADQLAGAVLTGAKLPEGSDGYGALPHVAEASRNAKNLFLSMLLVCGYTVLTAATTTDASLVTNSGTSPLPILGNEIPIVGFYLVAPVLLLGFYVYFHLYLQRLWESLGSLPAVLRDGRRLDKAVFPWALNGLVAAHRERLRPLPPYFGLQYWTSVLAAWGVLPLTILVLWGRFLYRQDTPGSIWLALAFVSSTGFGLSFFVTARSTLRGGLLKTPKPLAFDVRESLLEFARWACLVAVGLVFLASSYEAGRGSVLGYELSANFERQDVSVKPAGWRWEDLRLVHGARLAGGNLRNLKAEEASLAKANLQGADLTRADMRGADLRGANLQGAILDWADGREAILANEDGSYEAVGAPQWKWRRIRAGAFDMGCVEGDENCSDDERPRRPVEIPKDFEMNATEVTVAQYLQFAAETGNEIPQGQDLSRPGHPAVHVDWRRAQAYCEWAGGRLPTEAEWEYACRGGLEDSIYPWGDHPPSDEIARFGSRAGTAPVGSYSPNGFGLYDMAGNVWEWTADWYYPDPEDEQVSTQKGPEGGQYKLLRGGSWRLAALVSQDGRFLLTQGGDAVLLSGSETDRYLRCSYRYRFRPEGSRDDIGFRCVREVSH